MVRTKHITLAKKKIEEKSTQVPRLQMIPKVPIEDQIPIEDSDESTEEGSTSSSETTSTEETSATEDSQFSEEPIEDLYKITETLETIEVKPVIITRPQVARRCRLSVKRWVHVGYKKGLTIQTIAKRCRISEPKVKRIIEELRAEGELNKPIVEQAYRKDPSEEVRGLVYKLRNLGYSYSAINSCTGIPIPDVYTIIFIGERSGEISQMKYQPGQFAV